MTVVICRNCKKETLSIVEIAFNLFDKGVICHWCGGRYQFGSQFAFFYRTIEVILVIASIVYTFMESSIFPALIAFGIAFFLRAFVLFRFVSFIPAKPRKTPTINDYK